VRKGKVRKGGKEKDGAEGRREEGTEEGREGEGTCYIHTEPAQKWPRARVWSITVLYFTVLWGLLIFDIFIPRPGQGMTILYCHVLTWPYSTVRSGTLGTAGL